MPIDSVLNAIDFAMFSIPFNSTITVGSIVRYPPANNMKLLISNQTILKYQSIISKSRAIDEKLAT